LHDEIVETFLAGKLFEADEDGKLFSVTVLKTNLKNCSAKRVSYQTQFEKRIYIKWYLTFY
jgi:hypothetical protein